MHDPQIGLLTINHDILYAIMSFTTSRESLSSLMRTCRSLYTSGIPILLEGVVTLRSIRALGSFECFLSAKSDIDRSQFLHGLSISMDTSCVLQDPRNLLHIRRWTNPISGILYRASRLKILEIYSNTDEVIENMSGRIFDIISSMTTVRRARFSTISMETMTGFLDALSSCPLSVLSFSVGRKDPIGLLDLVEFKDTLTVLMAPFRHIHGLEVQFLQVQKLGLTIDGPTALENAGVVVSMFPNLRQLKLHSDFRYDPPSNINQDTRESNIAQIHECIEPWTSLDVVFGDLECLGTYAIQCPVRFLSLSCLLDDDPRLLMETVLQDMKPEILELKDIGVEVIRDGALMALHCSCLTPRLKTLFLKIDLGDVASDNSITIWVCVSPFACAQIMAYILTYVKWMQEPIMQGLKTLSLTSLIIRLQTTREAPEEWTGIARPQLPKYALDISQSISSLERVIFEFRKPSRALEPASGWYITGRDVGVLHLQEMSQNAINNEFLLSDSHRWNSKYFG